MNLFFRMMTYVAAIMLSGLLALAAASLLMNIGAFGSCFEGACGYVAAFVGLPVLWGGFSIASIVLLNLWMRRR